MLTFANQSPFSPIVVIALSLILSNAEIAGAADTNVDSQALECADKWDELHALYGEDIEMLSERWSAQSALCVGTGIYEYRKAMLAGKFGDWNLADSLLRSIVHQDMPYFQHEAEVAVAMISFNREISAPVINTAEVRRIHTVLMQFYEAYPTSVPAMEQVIIQKLYLDELEGAYAISRKAIGLDARSWAAHRGFVIASAKTGRCTNATDHVRPAIESNRDLFVDRDFIFAASYCYMQNGSLDVALQSLRRLHHGDPSVVEDSRYVNLAKAVLSAIDEDEVKAAN